MTKSRRASVLAGIFTVFALLSISGARAQNGVKIEAKIPYLGAPNNIRMSNGTVELNLTTDYGPRIMRYAFAGSGDNDNVLLK